MTFVIPAETLAFIAGFIAGAASILALGSYLNHLNKKRKRSP